MQDTFKVIGNVEFILKDANGHIKSQSFSKNLVVANGKDWIASRMISTSDAVMSHMSIGTGSTTPSSGNTALVTEVGRVALTSSTRTANQVTYSALFPAGTGTGAIQEAGIFNNVSLGTMLCRTVFSTINKDVLDTLTINWTITII
jgi:Phage tail-collar fibre protein